jgi:hypothetical protein
MADITEINGTKYEYEYKLSNADGEVLFNDTSVQSYDILNNFFDPFLDGVVVIANPYNFIEAKFLLKGDGTDIFKIKLTLQSDRSKTIDEEFVVVSEQNFIDDATALKNKKTYNITSKDAYTLRAKFPYGQRCRGNAGEIIKDIFEKLELKVDKIEPGDFIIRDNPEFLIPSMSFRYLDLLYYMLQYYYYIDGDIATKGFLRKTPNGYNMQIFSKLFSDNKKLVVETFTSDDIASSVSPNPNNPKATADAKRYTSSIVSNNLTSPAAQISNNFFMNTLVVGYNSILGDSEMVQLRIADIKSKWSKKFVDVFTSVGGKVKAFLNLNKIKTEEGFRVIRLPFSTYDSVNIVEAEAMSNLTLLNLQLNINVVGDTGRTPGTFIDVTKNKNEKAKSDEKLLGRWFVTAVRHVKILNTYRNEIYCVKTYAGPE